MTTSERVGAVSVTSPACGGGGAPSARPGRGPHQRHRLGQIADVVVREPEQHRIDALGDQPRMMPGLACRNDSAPVSAASAHPRSGIRGGAEILRHLPQFGVAAMLEGETVEESGEAVHVAATIHLPLAAEVGSAAAGGG